MALPVINNVYRVALEWADSAGGTAANVFHVLGVGMDADSVWEGCDEHLSDALFGGVSNTFSIVNIGVTPLDGESATRNGAPGTAIAGRATGDVVYQAAVLVKLETALRGKEHRGRMYCGPMGESQCVSGALVGATRIADDAAWKTFRNNMATELIPLVIASYKLETATVVSNVTVEPLLGTQRRRQGRRRGGN